MKMPEYAKAVAAGVSTAAGSVATALADGDLSQSELVGVLLAVVASVTAVYRVPNKKAAADG